MSQFLALRLLRHTDWGLRSYQGNQSRIWGGDGSCEHEWKNTAIKDEGYTSRKRWQHGHTRETNPIGWTTEELRHGAYCLHCSAWYGSLGLEPTIDQFVSNMVSVFREVWRVLHPTGQLFLNISDTRTKDRQWCGIPHRLVFVLQEDGWRFEDEVVWSKTNPMPGSQTNRFTRAHEFMFMLNKSKQAFFDLDAVNEAVAPSTYPRMRRGVGKMHKNTHGAPGQTPHTMNQFRLHANNIGTEPVPPNGRVRRSVWRISTQKYPGSHYATFPEALVSPCIKAGSSEHGICPVAGCGMPWERTTEPTGEYADALQLPQYPSGGTVSGNFKGPEYARVSRSIITTGWQPTCTCTRACPSCAGGSVDWTINSPCCQNKGYVPHEPIPAIILDPFVGSGTVPLVARKLGRRAVGLDLSYSYLHDQAKTRLGLTALEEWETGKDGDGAIDDLPLFMEAQC